MMPRLGRVLLAITAIGLPSAGCSQTDRDLWDPTFSTVSTHVQSQTRHSRVLPSLPGLSFMQRGSSLAPEWPSGVGPRRANVAVPLVASGTKRVVDPRSGVGIGIRTIDATEATGEVVAGLVVYAGALAGH